MPFPADGGAATVFADSADGILRPGAIAFASDGDLYFANIQSGNYVLRITPTGDASMFEDYGFDDPTALTADDAGTDDGDIDAPQPWDIWTRDPSVRIAVIDTGVNHTHADLFGNICTNSTEAPGDADFSIAVRQE